MTAECSYFRALMDAYAQTKKQGFWNHAKDYFNDFNEFHRFHGVLLQTYMKHVKQQHMTGYMVQKEPRLLRVWPELYDFWDKAGYVIIARDPRDIVASQLKRTNGNINLEQWFSEQLFNLQKAMTGRQKNIWVSYEKLVEYPHSQLEKLSERLGIEIPLKEWDCKREDDSCSPLDGKLPETSSIGRWKEELSKEIADGLYERRQWFIDTTGRDWFHE